MYSRMNSLIRKKKLLQAEERDKATKAKLDERAQFDSDYHKRKKHEKWTSELNALYEQPDKIDIVIDEIKKFQKQQNKSDEEMAKLFANPSKVSVADTMELHTTKKGKQTLLSPALKRYITQPRRPRQSRAPKPEHVLFEDDYEEPNELNDTFRTALNQSTNASIMQASPISIEDDGLHHHGEQREDGRMYNANTGRWILPDSFRRLT